MNQEKLLTYGFALFSAVTSFIFVFYAVNTSLGATAGWLKTFAYVVGGYGLFNIYILSWAWRVRAAWAPKADFVIAACFFGVFTMDTLRDGISDWVNEPAAIIGLAAILAINWFAVRKLCSRTSP
ncbi:MAG: hypothetical protein C0622_03740 [Desulfuromonas sp.]|nr:MAG: hypothetical protein C0622_03740 [Desulfuromonas sp.]